MRIFLLADPNSPHTVKWAVSLAKKGYNILIFGLGRFLEKESYSSYKNIEICTFNQSISRKEGVFYKLKYVLAIPSIRKLAKRFKPDIVHAHYATSYGLLGIMSGLKPFILSIWGSDIYSFPKKSFLHKIYIKYILYKSGCILSTSEAMAREAKIYTSKKIKVTPFGIDLNYFKPEKVESIFSDNSIVIGTIKSLEKVYGIDYLIKAFKIVSDKYSKIPLRLLIVGHGSLDRYLKELVRDLHIVNKTKFIGRVPHKQVGIYHNMMSIEVFASNSESFGVSVVEASACEKPVIVSDVGGLPEVVEDNISGIIVPSKNIDALAKAIECLVLNPQLGIDMGKSGRKRVKKFYNWEKNLESIIEIYKFASKHKHEEHLGMK